MKPVYSTPVQASAAPTPGSQHRGFQGLPTIPSAGGTQTGDILDYLKGRGGRIKELEEAVAEQRQAKETLALQLKAAQAEVDQLKQQLSGSSGSAAEGSHATQQAVYMAELEKLLDQQLSKELSLEQALSACKEKLTAAEQVATSTREALAAQQADAARAAATAAATLASVQKELSQVRQEAAEKMARADVAAKMESKRAAAALEMQQAASLALQEAERKLAAKDADLALLRQQLARRSTLPPAPAPWQLTTAAAASASLASPTAATPPAASHQQGGSRKRAEPDSGRHSSQHDSPSAAGGGAGDDGLAQQLADAQRQLQEWAQLYMVLPGTHDVAGVKAGVTNLVSDLEEARHTLQSRDAALLELRRAADDATASVAALTDQLTAVKAQAAAALTEQRIATKQMAVIAQERDRLREALMAPIPEAGSDSVVARLAVAQAASRAAQAEARAVQLAHDLEQAQAELAVLTRRESELQGTSEAATARAAAAEARVARLEAEADGLARDVAALQEKLGRGAFSASSNMRVLHLRMNPESEYKKQAAAGQVGELQAQVAALQSSLAQTQTALAAMEARALAAEQAGAAAGGSTAAGAGVGGQQQQAGAGGGGTAALMVQLNARDAEVAVLQHKLAEADKSGQRLREVFKQRAAAFREAVYCLFGYRVDMSSEATSACAAGSATTTFSLKPQHADSADALLVFRYTSDSGMQLVPTPFTQGRLAREVDTFVNRFHSIPALTANLTMESFQKQTQC